jgi:hypothetical protein
MGRYIGLGELVALEQEELTGRLGERTGKAVAKVQPGQVTAAPAEIAGGGALKPADDARAPALPPPSPR